MSQELSAATPHGRMTSRRHGLLIGREAELTTIVAAATEAAAGRSSVVLVSGEPGVGKSRLLTEVTAAEGSSALQWLRGYALEGGDLTPYSPLARALGPALPRAPPVDDSDFQALLPVLAAGGIGSVAVPVPAPLLPAAERLRLFDAIAEVCGALSRSRPLGIVLDDLQWAEAATWEALTYAARALTDARILLLLSVRDESLHTPGPARRAIDEFNRLRLLTHVPLRRLHADEVRLLAGNAVGGQVAPELAELIAERSRGNAFFVEELIYDLIDRAALVQVDGHWRLRPQGEHSPVSALPLTLQLAIDGRTERLPMETRLTLTAAAILGKTFPVRILAAMLDWSRGRVEAALGAASTAGLIESTADGYAFVHDTVREAIYAGAGSDRRRLHAAAAGAIAAAAGAADQNATQTALAHHWRLADEPARAATAALAVALALASHAPAEALAYARLGHELRERAAGGEATIAERQDACLAHGEAALAAGEYAEAEAALREALTSAQTLSDRRREGEVWLRLGVVYKRREAPREAAGCLRSAIHLLGAFTSDLPELAEALTELAGLEGVTRAHYDEAEQLAQRAIAMAERLAEPLLEAGATLALANTRGRLGDPAAVRPLLEHALERALAGDRVALAADVCATLANTCYWTGGLNASRLYAERRLELARQIGDSFGLRHAHSWLANLAWSRGDWDLAR
ncbi:MAG: ATP-binding protein, partial [Dehalococcoidia bacterium]